MAKKKVEESINKTINLAQARQILKYLDNIWYVPLNIHAELDELVTHIINSDEYKKAREDVEKKAQELLWAYNEKESKVRWQINEMESKFDWLKKKEAKKLRQEIWLLEQSIKDSFSEAKQSLQVYQNARMDTEARDIIIDEVSPELYETLERKFYIEDFAGEAKPVESTIDTDKLATTIL